VPIADITQHATTPQGTGHISGFATWIILSTPLRSGSGVLDFGGTSCVLNVEAEYERVGVVMAGDLDNKNVFMVAAIIGEGVLLLSLGGVLSLVL